MGGGLRIRHHGALAGAGQEAERARPARRRGRRAAHRQLRAGPGGPGGLRGLLGQRREGRPGVRGERARHGRGGRFCSGVQRAAGLLRPGEAAAQPLRGRERHGLRLLARGPLGPRHPQGRAAADRHRPGALRGGDRGHVREPRALHGGRLLQHGQVHHRPGGQGESARGDLLPRARAGPERAPPPRRPGGALRAPQHAAAHPEGREALAAAPGGRGADRGGAARLPGPAAERLPAAAAPTAERP
mmetsp:Transcript_102351/g.248799  ORF Transcript_102351/g.248799 Transcript_102351/m.248799 type:complete len:245 (-) Transcript_102351:947-1681(-)